MSTEKRINSELAAECEAQKAERDALADRVNALAVENQALKSAHPQPFGREMMKALDAYERHQDEVPETGMLDAFFILRDSIRVETPATSAALAAIREQACKALIDAFVRQVDAAGLDDSDSVTIFECRDTMKYAAEQVINPREAK